MPSDTFYLLIKIGVGKLWLYSTLPSIKPSSLALYMRAINVSCVVGLLLLPQLLSGQQLIGPMGRQPRQPVAPIQRRPVGPTQRVSPKNVKPSTPILEEHVLEAGGLSRTYLIHLPQGYGRNRFYPLVLVFHDELHTPREIVALTRFNEVADQEGFIVVYPQGIEGHWNDGRPTHEENLNDVNYLKVLLNFLKERVLVDSKRIYATGYSNGGMFALRLACELSDKLAAIAPVAALMPSIYAPACQPENPVSVLFIEGAADPVLPMQGGIINAELAAGLGGNVQSLDSTMSFWVNLDHCRPKRQDNQLLITPTAGDFTRVSLSQHLKGRQGTEVALYWVERGGHVWPSAAGLPNPALGQPTYQLNATQAIWEFFKAHPKK